MVLTINGETVRAVDDGDIHQIYEFPAPSDKMEFVLLDDQGRPTNIRYVYQPVDAGDVVELSWQFRQDMEITEEDIYEKRLQYEPITIRVGKRRWVKIGFYKVLDF